MQTVRIGYVEIGEGRPCIIAPLTSSSIDGVMDTATSLADLPVELAEWRIDMFADAVVETPEGLMPDLPYILQSLAGLRTVIPVALIATFPLAPSSFGVILRNSSTKITITFLC